MNDSINVLHKDNPSIQSSNAQAKNAKKSIDLHKPRFLSIECHIRLLPDALCVVDGEVDPKPSRSEHSHRSAFVVLHMNGVLAKLEPLQNFFLDHKATERLT